MNQRTGVITRIVTDRATGARKGFGFIKDETDNSEYFFHRSALARSVDFETLPEGGRVTYVIGEDKGKGPRAENLVLL